METSIGGQTGQATVYQYVARDKPGRVKGRVAPMRDGALTVTQEGMFFSGKAMLSPGKQALWLLGGVLISLIVAALLIEYVLREQRAEQMRWEDIDEVVMEPKTSRACVVYRDAKRRQQSFAFRLESYQYSHFEQVVRYFAPTKLRTGKIGSVTSPWVYAFIVFVLFLVIFVAIMASGK